MLLEFKKDCAKAAKAADQNCILERTFISIKVHRDLQPLPNETEQASPYVPRRPVAEPTNELSEF